MAKRVLTVADLDNLLVVLQDNENLVPGPMDMRLASYCVQLVRATLIAPSATPDFDFTDEEELF